MADGNTELDREMLAAIDAEISGALGTDSSALSEQRTEAMERYLGEPYGNEQPDRSNVTTREVMDTIEWIKPELMKLFASGGDTVRFEPETAEDVAQAQQETDYVNYVFHRKNPGFRILYEWVNDGLLQKNGIVKCWWDPSPVMRREEYQGLTETELLSLARDENVEILSQDSRPDPVAEQQLEMARAQMQTQLQQAAQQLPPEQVAQLQQQMAMGLPEVPMVHDVVVKVAGPPKGITIENVPPEEFSISHRAKSVQDSPFCAHERETTVSELRLMGYDEELLKDLPTAGPQSYIREEKRARHSYDETDEHEGAGNEDGPNKRVWVTEAYIRYDFDEDGISELRKVVRVGDRILENEEVDCMPFAGWTPIIISHKFYGLSMADLVMDIQRIKTQLFRNLLDNQYLSNNGRYEAVENMVNLDDLMSSRPHGVVRTKMVGAVKRLDTPQLGQTAFAMLEYVDQMREKRTGVSERTQGLDPKALGSNTAATAVNQVMTAAQQRVELIARVFAETGLTDLFRLIHKLVIQNATRREIFRLRDQYVEVNPRTWHERTDTTVVVGLGNGSREQEMLQLNMIFQNQMTLAQNPLFASLVAPQNVYKTLEDQVKVFDKAASGRYFTDPESPEAKQRMMQQQQAQQQMQQMQQAMQQMQVQLEQQKVQIDQFKAQSADENKKAEIAIKRDAHELDKQEHEDNLAVDTAELALEAEQGRAVEIG